MTSERPDGTTPLPDDVPQLPVPLLDADAATAGGESALPGAHRGGFRRPLTEPIEIASAANLPVPETPDLRWVPPPPPPLPRSAGWALTFAILALAISLLVGWGFPAGMLGAVLAIVALRRPWENRGIAVWALCLSVLSLAYSAGWLWWAHLQGALWS